MTEQFDRTAEHAGEGQARHGFGLGRGHGPCGWHGPRGHHMGGGHRHAHHMGHHGAPAGPRGFRRHVATREEQLSSLEDYLSALRAETQAVEERIAELEQR